jgi:hypothetical protein
VKQTSYSGRSTSPNLVPDPGSPAAQALKAERDALQREVRGSCCVCERYWVLVHAVDEEGAWARFV